MFNTRTLTARNGYGTKDRKTLSFQLAKPKKLVQRKNRWSTWFHLNALVLQCGSHQLMIHSLPVESISLSQIPAKSILKSKIPIHQLLPRKPSSTWVQPPLNSLHGLNHGPFLDWTQLLDSIWALRTARLIKISGSKLNLHNLAMFTKLSLREELIMTNHN